jgi:hypothetical protein
MPHEAIVIALRAQSRAIEKTTMGRVRLVALALLVAAACAGRSNDSPGGDDAGSHAYTSSFPRLSHWQWENTVQDLLGLPEPPGLAPGFDPDPPLGRFDNNLTRLRMTPGLWQDYQRAAEVMAARVTADPAALDRVLPADLPADGSARTRAFIEQFGARALRRPLAAAEVDRYQALFDAAPRHYQADMDPWVAGVRITIEAMLQSPHFVYRAELGAQPEDGADGEIKLSAYQVASRLSYALWNTMPDDELMAAAAEGSLDTEEGVRAQALRMQDDPRTRASLAHFHRQVFALHEYADQSKHLALFPEWRPELGALMAEEAELFLAALVFERDGTIGDIFTSTLTYVNAELAAIYGLEGDFGSELVPAELDSGTRAGFLTRLGFLTRNATLTEPDPIHRGVFVNLNILCRPIAAVPSLPDDLIPVGKTNRERINSITGPGTCGQRCHATIINPIGFGLEHYDAIGRHRTEDRGYPVNAADTYVFAEGRSITFEDGVELSHELARAPEAHACYVSNLLEYLYGGEHGADPGVVRELTRLSVEDGASIRELMGALASSRAFRYRLPAGKE